MKDKTGGAAEASRPGAGNRGQRSQTPSRATIGTVLWLRLPAWAKHLLLWLVNTHFIVGTVAIVSDGEGRVLVARHTYRRRRPWALPGGWVRRGESPADAVVREILEETGLAVEVARPLTVQPESPVHLTVVYAARLAGGSFRPSLEVSEVRFLEPGLYPEGLREDHRALIEVFARHHRSTRDNA